MQNSNTGVCLSEVGGASERRTPARSATYRWGGAAQAAADLGTLKIRCQAAFARCRDQIVKFIAFVKRVVASPPTLPPHSPPTRLCGTALTHLG